MKELVALREIMRQQKFQELMKDDEPTEKEKALEQQLAALREIVNKQK